MEYYEAIRKKKILPFATTWICRQGIMPDRGQIMYNLTYMWNLKKAKLI